MKLPIQPLLYLTSAGLAAGSGWTFYDTMSRDPLPSRTEITDTTTETIDRGRKLTPDDRRDAYDAQDWWSNLTKVNFIGKEPPKPKAVKSNEPPPPPPPSQLPIEEILDIVCIVYDPGGEKPGGNSRCVVRYKQTANVTPPESSKPVVPKAWGGPSDVRQPPRPQGNRGGNRGGNRPGNAGRPNARPGMPQFGQNPDAPVQHLMVGETLWPGYEHIRLARVQPDAEAVFFVRDGGEAATEGEGNGSGPSEPAEEKVFKNELNLDKDVLEALSKGGFEVSARPTDPARTRCPRRRWDRVGRRVRDQGGAAG